MSGGAGCFLTDEQAEAYARFAGAPFQTELERFFFLDDADRSAVEKRRGDANRLGFGVQLGTVRQLGAFLAAPWTSPPKWSTTWPASWGSRTLRA